MTFTFRPAVRERASLLIGLAGTSGSGKTLSSLKLAAGLSGDKPFAVIDTEAGRALHYADEFKFDHGELRAPFRPEAYMEAISAADDEGYPVVVVDSHSHVWNGPGGILDWHEEELQRMAGNDFGKRERVKMSAWIQPKRSNKRMVARMLQCRAHVIFCLRAEPKVAMVKDDRGKTQIVDKGIVPICDSQFMYEMTISLLMSTENPGAFTSIKLQDQHKPMLAAGRKVTVDAGKALAAWANGGKVERQKPEPEQDESEDVMAGAWAAADQGTEALRELWKHLGKDDQATVRPHADELRARAEQADVEDDPGDPFTLESGEPTDPIAALSEAQVDFTTVVEQEMARAGDLAMLETVWHRRRQAIAGLPDEGRGFLEKRYQDCVTTLDPSVGGRAP